MTRARRGDGLGELAEEPSPKPTFSPYLPHNGPAVLETLYCFPRWPAVNSAEFNSSARRTCKIKKPEPLARFPVQIFENVLYCSLDSITFVPTVIVYAMRSTRKCQIRRKGEACTNIAGQASLQSSRSIYLFIFFFLLTVNTNGKNNEKLMTTDFGVKPFRRHKYVFK